MSEVNMAVIKPEMMKSYIWLQTADGSIQQVEQEAAMFCPMICHEVIQKGMGSSKSYAISLPQRVNPASLSLILDYCRFHQVPGRSNKECKSFDEKFIRMDTKRLCELTSAADSLQLKPLVDLTSRALARIIEGRSPEEIREIFHLPDDLTEEEKLEPLKNTTDDPRIRLLNRLYAKKRKELKERDKLKIVEVEEDHVDDRSVDDLLSFINGGDSKGIRMSKNKKKHRRRKDQQKSASGDETIKTDEQEEKLEPLNNTTGNPRIRLLNRMYAKKRKELKERDKLKIVEVEEDRVDDRSVDDLLSFINGDSKGIRMSKNKKKHRRRKDQQKSASGDETIKTAEQESNGLNSLCHCAEVGNELRPDQGETSNMQYIEDDFFARKSEPDDGDVDDEIDPALKEKIDREVEDFARRLNSDWPERMQEILSLGQEIRPIYYSANGNGRRYANREQK